MTTNEHLSETTAGRTGNAATPGHTGAPRDAAGRLPRDILGGTVFGDGTLGSDCALNYYALRRAVGVPCAGEPGDPRATRAWDTDRGTALRQVRPLPGAEPVGFPPGMLHLIEPHTAGELRAFCGRNQHMRPIADRLAGVNPAARTDGGAHAIPALGHVQHNVQYPLLEQIVFKALRHAREPGVIASAAGRAARVVPGRPGRHFLVVNGCSGTGAGGLPTLLTLLTNCCIEIGAEYDEIIPIILGPLTSTAGDRDAVRSIYYYTLLQVLDGYLNPERTTIRTPGGVVRPKRPFFTRGLVVDAATPDYSYARSAVPHAVAHFLLADLDEPLARAERDSYFADADGDVDAVGDAVGPRVWTRFGLHAWRIESEYSARRLRTFCRRRVAELIA